MRLTPAARATLILTWGECLTIYRSNKLHPSVRDRVKLNHRDHTSINYEKSILLVPGNTYTHYLNLFSFILLCGKDDGL